MGSLSERQTSIIVGCLLGDGAMRCKNNALLEINHSFKQRTYVDWKYQQLKNIVISPPKKRCGNFDISEQLQLIRLLESAYGIKASLNKDKKYWRLRVAVASIGKLKRLIGPNILPCLTYKLPS